VVSLDVWYNSQPQPVDYQQIQSIAAPGGKPIAIAETGKAPTAASCPASPAGRTS
jgi:hypothetical protein